MAVVNTKTTQITNGDAGPTTLTNNQIVCGRVLSAVGTLEVAAADDDTSTFRFVRVHSSWLILSIRVYCDALTSGTSYDCGLYQTAANGGAVVDVDAFASAVSLASAITTGTEIRFEASDIASIEKPVWEIAGLTSDPNRWYDVVLTANTIGSAAGTITIAVLAAAP